MLDMGSVVSEDFGKQWDMAHLFNASVDQLSRRGLPRDILQVQGMQTRALDALSQMKTGEVTENVLNVIEMAMHGAYHEGLANKDDLTGFLSPRGIRVELLERIAKHNRSKVGGFGVLVIDLIKFKTINDAVGHGGGNEVLRMVADTMRKFSRLEDGLGRVGGDEFVLIFDGDSEAQANEMIFRHRHARDRTGQLPGWLDAVNGQIAQQLALMPEVKKLGDDLSGCGQLRAGLLFFDNGREELLDKMLSSGREDLVGNVVRKIENELKRIKGSSD